MNIARRINKIMKKSENVVLNKSTEDKILMLLCENDIPHTITAVGSHKIACVTITFKSKKGKVESVSFYRITK